MFSKKLNDASDSTVEQQSYNDPKRLEQHGSALKDCPGMQTSLDPALNPSVVPNKSVTQRSAEGEAPRQTEGSLSSMLGLGGSANSGEVTETSQRDNASLCTGQEVSNGNSTQLPQLGSTTQAQPGNDQRERQDEPKGSGISSILGLSGNQNQGSQGKSGGIIGSMFGIGGNAQRGECEEVSNTATESTRNTLHQNSRDTTDTNDKKGGGIASMLGFGESKSDGGLANIVGIGNQEGNTDKSSGIAGILGFGNKTSEGSEENKGSGGLGSLLGFGNRSNQGLHEQSGTHQVEDQAQKVNQQLGDNLEKAEDYIRDSSKSGSSEIHGKDALVGRSKSTVESIGDSLKKVHDDAGNRMQGSKERTADESQKAKEQIEDSLKQTGKYVDDSYRGDTKQNRDGEHNLQGRTQSTVKDAGDAVKNVYNEAGNRFQESMGKTADFVRKNFDASPDSQADTAEKQNPAGNAGKSVNSATESLERLQVSGKDDRGAPRSSSEPSVLRGDSSGITKQAVKDQAGGLNEYSAKNENMANRNSRTDTTGSSENSKQQ